MHFKKLVAVDNTGLEEAAKEELTKYAEAVVLYEDFPTDPLEIVSRINGKTSNRTHADAVLVSWNTQIDRSIIEQCPSIRYIGMCCSLLDEKSANVDIQAARERGIQVLGIYDYGDEGVIEFIISELIRLFHGFGEHMWQEEPVELTGHKLGIIGLGTTGKMLADTALAFGMKVFYHSRSRKPDYEKKGVEYLELTELLSTVEVVSTHLPKHTVVFGQKEFEELGNGKILINTSLEPTFEIEPFIEWIKTENNYAIFDKVAMGSQFERLKDLEGVIYSNKVSGWTKQAKKRLSEKVIKNIETFLSNS
ncbi:MAG TPA: NAD(P)-dependent oxidoreductase [Thermotogota bacterium]|nr:NAD(P)-dependent oxidoreductase [Thermotogota bacterium]